VTENKRADSDNQQINLEEVAQLIEALERDLAQVRSGSQDVQRLRDEVETLKNVLNSPIRRHHWVKDGLHSVREGIDDALDSALAEAMKAGQYVSEIGRILGL
jgi:cell division septum initiation protein DivIVA